MAVTRAGLISAMMVAVLLHSGCSLLFVKGPPAEHAQMVTFECSDSKALPVLDTIWAGLNGLGAASAANDNQNPDQGQIIAVGLAWLAVSGISAIYGFSKVSACSDAKQQRDERLSQGGFAAPAPTPVPAWSPAAPRLDTVRAAPAAAPVPTAAPAPAAAPASTAPAAAPASTAPAAAPASTAPAVPPAPAASGTAPAPPAAPGSTAPAPRASLSPPYSLPPVHPAARSSSSRSLAMRPALATH
jgi:hypothetical protein